MYIYILIVSTSFLLLLVRHLLLEAMHLFLVASALQIAASCSHHRRVEDGDVVNAASSRALCQCGVDLQTSRGNQP